MNCRLTLALILLGSGLGLSTSTLQAQEVRWRHDYVQARQEAAKAYKPLLLDFGTEQCIWCKKLDATTFRDPQVIQLLNDNYIPVKIDGNRDVQLVQTLKIQSYPTLVFAAPDGHILGMNPGYMDANSLSKMLTQAASRIPARQVPVAANNPVMNPQPNPSMVMVSTNSPAIQIPTPASLGIQPANASNMMATPATELLKQAKVDLDQGCFMGALEKCRKLIREYPGHVEASEARQLMQRLTREPAIANRLGHELADQLGEVLLARAEIFDQAGRPTDAIACLEYLIRACPDTTWSTQAHARLAQLSGRRLQNMQMVPVSNNR